MIKNLGIKFIEIIGGSSIKKERVVSYTILDENSKDSSEYSFWKGALGVALFGGIGAALDEKYYKVFIASMF